MNDTAFEINFDGLSGPTHNYAGLSYGNIASEQNQKLESNPKAAALQGLAKMKFMADLGIGQAVLPPHERPHLAALRQLGFNGTDAEILAQVHKNAPELLAAVSSAAAMWTANAATISPSADTEDNKVHITPANLCSNYHRMIEAQTTAQVLKAIFKDPNYFVHHDPLPSCSLFADEGAANHSRISNQYSDQGIELFVYGKNPLNHNGFTPSIYPARQTLAACQAIARRHRLHPERVIFAQQNPLAIDAGAFHNDVVAVGNQHLFICHENAFVDQQNVIDQMRSKCAVNLIEVKSNDIPLKMAIETYLFNSQLVRLPNGTMALIAPHECFENPTTKAYIDNLVSNQSNPISVAHFLNLRQSMRNGGGPACLRLRVVLTKEELAATNSHFFLDGILYKRLVDWVDRYYRDRLLPADLADPQLLVEVQEALESLKNILPT